MAKYDKRHSKGSVRTLEEANKLAKANQRPGQTKEQTKIIAQGIQKGIEQYKKQHKAKSRELDKQLKAAEKAKQMASSSEEKQLEEHVQPPKAQTWLPWSLLVLSWVLFAIFQVI